LLHCIFIRVVYILIYSLVYVRFSCVYEAQLYELAGLVFSGCKALFRRSFLTRIEYIFTGRVHGGGSLGLDLWNTIPSPTRTRYAGTYDGSSIHFRA
jgi:hypothetical protein